MGRTTLKHARFYADGYDLSGFVRTFGPLAWDYDEDIGAALTDECKSAQFGQPQISIGTLNTYLDPVSNGAHDVFKSRAERVVMIPIGDRAAPAAGVPVFGGKFGQAGYKGLEGDISVVATIPFGGWSNEGLSDYDQPWGRLLHPKGAETAVNSGTSDHDHGAQTTAGGYMIYQLFSSDGTVTLKTQDASTDSNPSFGDLLTSGSLDASAIPVAGIVALSKTATVERYTRWQIVLGTATTCTFALMFVRGR